MEKQNIGEGLKRITIIDSLRGFALFGIIIIHMAVLFNSIDYTSLNAKNHLNVNGIVHDIVGNLFSGKFVAIFSFLFGLSYFIQMDRAAQKGINYQWRFLWRISILFLIGLIHGLLFSGDILIIYALLGIPLIFLYKVKDKVLIVLIIILLLGIPRFISFGITHNKAGTSNIVKQKEIKDRAATVYKIYDEGSIIDVIKYNAYAQLTIKLDDEFGKEGRAYQSLAMFFLGLLVGRRRYFEKIEENLTLTRKIFFRTILFALGFRIISYVIFVITKKNEEEFLFQIGMTFFNLFNLSAGLLITMAFVLTYQTFIGQRILVKLVPYGKMGLSNYIMQSVIAIPLLYGFGLGLAPHINAGIGVGIGIIIYGIQVEYSKWWLNNFKYGPFEWAWRSLTWLKWQPFRKNVQISSKPKNSNINKFGEVFT